MFAFTILGLPAHPLIVHGAVVFIPLATLAVLGYVLRPSLRVAYWKPCVVTVVIAEACSFLAGQTGEQLQQAMRHSRLIRVHAEWADRLGLAMHALFAVFLLVVIVDRHQVLAKYAVVASGTARRVAAALAVVLAIVVLVLVAVVGHLGARAAWHSSPAASAAQRHLAS